MPAPPKVRYRRPTVKLELEALTDRILLSVSGLVSPLVVATTPLHGSGNGDGTMTTAQEVPHASHSLHHRQDHISTVSNQSSTLVAQPADMGSGSGSGSSSGSVSGEVWLDNNGGGILNGMDFSLSGFPVNLDSPTGQTLMSTTTDANGNYHFNVDLSLGYQFEIQVPIPNGYTPTLNQGVLIQKNKAASGGGLYLVMNSTTALNTVTIQGNQLVGVGGAGVGIFKSNPITYKPTNVTNPDGTN
ncbi:MAG TPA: SdrD B-like domain-containing protein [Gemmataceae bacterium]|nr:SdrD B-like domain-containing protein [Gemmataceae bacterium]